MNEVGVNSPLHVSRLSRNRAAIRLGRTANSSNVCLAIGAILKPELRRLFQDVHLALRDRNRTGFTNAMYVANFSDAIVLKVSEHRKITLFCKRDGTLEPEVVDSCNLKQRLYSIIG